MDPENYTPYIYIYICDANEYDKRHDNCTLEQQAMLSESDTFKHPYMFTCVYLLSPKSKREMAMTDANTKNPKESRGA